MKKLISISVCFIVSFTVGFVYAKDPLHVFIGNREVENNGEYIIKDNKMYVSEDALKKDFGFNVFYDKNSNAVTLNDDKKLALESKTKLFEQFIEGYEPKTPEEAAKVWVDGVKDRNGISQYAVLSKPLKEKFKAMIEKHGSWITGFSSPWIENYKITERKVNQSTWEYKIVFKAATSAPETYTWHATLLISKENNGWKIVDVQKDFDLM